jgi:diguanylate cyclase (GGDEF)-like protein
LKIKYYWMIPASFIPAAIFILTQKPDFFSKGLFFNDLIAPTGILLLTLLLVWEKYCVAPARNFHNTITRVIHADYRARFSCDKNNTTFHQLSLSFNQFMTIVEKQTDELAENRHLQNQLLDNEKIYRTALELTCERVFEADLNHNRLIYGQEIYNRTFPFLKTELYSDLVKSIAENAVYYEDAEQYYSSVRRENLINVFTTTDTTEVNVEFRQLTENGKDIWVSATIIHLSDEDSRSLKVIGYVKNIDARKRSELEIYKQSQRDGLTMLYNKMVTQSMIEDFLNGEGCSGKHAAIMLDIDNFKLINDTLGHIQGDATLLRVAERLRCLFMDTDIVGRIGGDEFFILFKNYGSYEELLQKLNSICNMFKGIFFEEGEKYKISGSIGVALYPEDGKNYGELYKKSDDALYVAKRNGKNCYFICNNCFGLKSADTEIDFNNIEHLDFQYTYHTNRKSINQ